MIVYGKFSINYKSMYLSYLYSLCTGLPVAELAPGLRPLGQSEDYQECNDKRERLT